MGGKLTDEHETCSLLHASLPHAKLNTDPFFAKTGQYLEREFARDGIEEIPSYPSRQTLHELNPLDTAYGPYEIIAVDDSRDTTHNA